MKEKLLFTEKDKWKDQDYELELYILNDYHDLPKINQVQAVCFLDSKQVVFYKNIEGYFGNPGGTVEKGENVEETLKRELIEEAQLKLLDWKTIGVEKVFYPNKANSKRKTYFLRVIAKVKLIDKKIKDPDGKAVGRIVIGTDEATNKLNWGEKGKQLIELAKSKYIEFWEQ